MRGRLITAVALVLGLVGVRGAGAQTFGPEGPPPRVSAFEKLTFAAPTFAAPTFENLTFEIPAATDVAAPQRPRAFEYSEGYRKRAKIHRIASIATLPLFALQGIVGQSLYSNPTDGKRSTHLVIASTMGALFAVNTVTGVWNLVEARKDPNGTGRRTLHGILMLVADAGFLATAMTAPGNEAGKGSSGNRSTHRAIALTSIGVATVSYVIMLFGR